MCTEFLSGVSWDTSGSSLEGLCRKCSWLRGNVLQAQIFTRFLPRLVGNAEGRSQRNPGAAGSKAAQSLLALGRGRGSDSTFQAVALHQAFPVGICDINWKAQ